MSASATSETKLAPCENCGRKERLTVLAVIEKVTGKGRALALCAQCEGSRFRACWLRYERADNE